MCGCHAMHGELRGVTAALCGVRLCQAESLNLFQLVAAPREKEKPPKTSRSEQSEATHEHILKKIYVNKEQLNILVIRCTAALYGVRLFQAESLMLLQ